MYLSSKKPDSTTYEKLISIGELINYIFGPQEYKVNFCILIKKKDDNNQPKKNKKQKRIDA